jgi:TusA-related sulfurtransferase
LDKIAADLRPYDEPLAGALQALMSAQPGGVLHVFSDEELAEKPVFRASARKKNPELTDALQPAGRTVPKKKSREKSVDSIPGLIAPPAGVAGMVLTVPPYLLKPVEGLSALEFGLSSHPAPSVVDAPALIAAMLANLAPVKNDYMPAALPRLAHAAAAAQAELALIEEAKTSPEARRLLVQLETIMTCEQGLY